jgi:hypothetical protein
LNSVDQTIEIAGNNAIVRHIFTGENESEGKTNAVKIQASTSVVLSVQPLTPFDELRTGFDWLRTNGGRSKHQGER